MTIYTALITPFHNDQLDLEGLGENIRIQQAAGVDGLLLLGSTGESPTLSAKERIQLLAEAKTDLRLMVGCGASSTWQTIENCKQAADFGAHEVLVVSPPYNLPTPEGLLKHFETVADHSPLPLVLYNHPGRTQVTLCPQTIAILSKHPNITGLKQTVSDPVQFEEIKLLTHDFKIFAGDDLTALAFMALGADGLISTASNLIPEQMKKLISSDLQEARELLGQLWPLLKLLTCSTNPIPIKAAMQLAGYASGEPRLPLLPLDHEKRALLQAQIEELNALC